MQPQQKLVTQINNQRCIGNNAQVHQGGVWMVRDAPAWIRQQQRIVWMWIAQRFHISNHVLSTQQ